MRFINIVMKIDNNSVSFKANFVNKINIGKVIENRYPNYKQQAVSFIKIDPANSRDIKALEEIANYWIYSDFAVNIHNAARELKSKNMAYKNHEIYALTTQKSNFEKLKSDELLGLIHTCPSDNGFTSIEDIQGDPQYIYDIEPDYKGIGTGILDSLKLIYDKLSCHPANNDYVIRFYVKNGFIKQADKPNYYTYCKQC